MAFAITVECVALEPAATLRARLESALRALTDDGGRPLVDALREQETEQCVNRMFDGAAHRGEIPPGLRAQLKHAEDRAMVSARTYERLAHEETHVALLFEEIKALGLDAAVPPEIVQGVAAALAAARANEANALAQARDDEKKALEAKARCKAAIDPVHHDHVADTFDKIISGNLDAVAAQVTSGMLGPGATGVKFQIAGHVEDKRIGKAQGSAHIWPMPE